VIAPAQRTALAVRDGGCVSPGWERPPGWCEGTTGGTGWTAGRPTCGTWRGGAAPTIAPSTTATSTWIRRIDDDPPPPDTAAA